MKNMIAKPITSALRYMNTYTTQNRLGWADISSVRQTYLAPCHVSHELLGGNFLRDIHATYGCITAASDRNCHNS